VRVELAGAREKLRVLRMELSASLDGLVLVDSHSTVTEEHSDDESEAGWGKRILDAGLEGATRVVDGANRLLSGESENGRELKEFAVDFAIVGGALFLAGAVLARGGRRK